MAAGQPEAVRSSDAAGAEPEFQTVWRGFDPEQVRAYLRQVMGRFEVVNSQLGRTQRLLEDARRERDLARNTAGLGSLEDASSYVVDLIRRFDQDVQSLRQQAEADATGILAEARSEAAELRMQAEADEQEARAHAEEVLRATREEAERLQMELEPVREATLGQIREMRDRLAASVRELDRVLGPRTSDEPVIVLDEAEEESPPAEEEPAQAPVPRPDLAM